MAKILYAAGNREGGYSQLKRYLPLFKGSKHIFKIAGYKNSIQNLNADYCLDALLNFIKPQSKLSYNGNYNYYSKEIEKFKPDLIISDFEPFTSLIAVKQKISLWQVSPALLYYATPKPIREYFGGRFEQSFFDNTLDRPIANYILNNSNKKFVVSHFGEIKKPLELEYGFSFCRPEFRIDNSNAICSTGHGFSTELADAFYNEQYSLLTLNKQDQETVANVYASIYYGLGQLKSDPIKLKKINININDNIKFLMELI